MSAMTLMTPGDPVAVEDELESFFNVLLYFSVRFLPHNCDKVADFMHAYFDDYSTLGHNYGCGIYKKACMETGRLDFNTPSRLKEGPKDGATTPVAKVRKCLKIGWLEPTGALEPGLAHPLNKIITTILKWIQGRYFFEEVDEIEEDAERRNNASKNDEEFDFDDNDTEPESSEGVPLHFQDTIEDPAKAEAHAANLRTHSAILGLLKRAVTNEDWPMADKLADQLPKKGYQEDAITSSAVSKAVGSSRKPIMYCSTTSSRKRAAAEVEAVEVAGPSKRSK